MGQYDVQRTVDNRSGRAARDHSQSRGLRMLPLGESRICISDSDAPCRMSFGRAVMAASQYTP